MPIYLVGQKFAITMELSHRYKGRWRVMGKELYLDVACTQPVKKQLLPQSIAKSCEAAYRLRTDEKPFHEFLLAWMANTLVLYRGLPGCHFCWPGLLKGKLESEGLEDYPTFTMSESGKGSTRWLPTAERDTAQGASVQCVDPLTKKLSLGEPVPIGFTVAIPAGSARNLPLCWLNAGEVVVRGPLWLPAYRMHSITWLDRQQVDFRAWPIQMPDEFLPPQRPYKPGSEKILEDWWESQRCQVWMQKLAKYDHVIRSATERRVLASVRRTILRTNLESMELL